MMMVMMMIRQLVVLVRHVSSVSWCLASAHLSKGLLCVAHRSSVSICRVSTTASETTLTRLHGVSIAAVPQGVCAADHFNSAQYCIVCTHTAPVAFLLTVNSEVLRVFVWRATQRYQQSYTCWFSA